VSELYSVVTFAYNEEKTIGNTIASILANCDQRLAKLTIVANGCNDHTVEVARESVKGSSVACAVIELALGDKCNAWNEYLYHHLPEATVHFFVDSDVTFTDKAFPLLFDQLLASPDKNAVTGLPQTGRNIKQYIELATRYSCLFGNLYGLTNEFTKRLIGQNIRLPVGLSWIDAQITKLVNDNLEYKKDDYQQRVTFLEGVGYQFESLKPWRPADVRLYINRICRYKVGQLQEPYLDALPFVDWPHNMDEINRLVSAEGLDISALGKLLPLKKRIRQRLDKVHDQYN
jgi:glycosyltransferase involved in cell wall biosynthesis